LKLYDSTSDVSAGIAVDSTSDVSAGIAVDIQSWWRGMFFIHNILKACLKYQHSLFPYILTSILCEIELCRSFQKFCTLRLRGQ
jgi:hypothetical protein